MTKDSVTYPPLDTAKTVGKNVWIVDSGPMMAAGMIPLPVRMTVIQLSGGDLLLHSPTQYHEQLHRELEAIGPVKHLVAPNVAHWTFVQAWQSHLPDATTWGAQGLRQRSQVKRSGLRLDHDLGAVAPAAWADEIEHIAIDGMGGFSAVSVRSSGSKAAAGADAASPGAPLVREAVWDWQRHGRGHFQTTA